MGGITILRALRVRYMGGPQKPHLVLYSSRSLGMSDTGFSGAKESRPGLPMELMGRRAARLPRLRVDRANRSNFQQAIASPKASSPGALETFQALGIAFVSLTESVDTSTPYGKLVFTILGAVAELERSLIAERIRNGMKKKGAKKPGPKVAESGPSRTTLWRRAHAK
jgi:DNA invertase Pin-like site-specific DNA recombinase